MARRGLSGLALAVALVFVEGGVALGGSRARLRSRGLRPRRRDLRGARRGRRRREGRVPLRGEAPGEPAQARCALAAGDGGDGVDLAELAEAEGATGLLEGVEDGGALFETACRALPFADDAELAAGRLGRSRCSKMRRCRTGRCGRCGRSRSRRRRAGRRSIRRVAQAGAAPAAFAGEVAAACEAGARHLRGACVRRARRPGSR
ncbi:MAG: hypothetical protein R3F14_12940 [Polyangiaceae bacterium]